MEEDSVVVVAPSRVPLSHKADATTQTAHSQVSINGEINGSVEGWTSYVSLKIFRYPPLSCPYHFGINKWHSCRLIR